MERGSKYAVIVPCSGGYTYGLNTLLNGLDYYGNTADVHILWYGDPAMETNVIVREFFDKLPTAGFCFKVFVKNINELFTDPRQPDDVFNDDPIYRLTFSRWLYSSFPEMQEYEAVMNTGADVMCTDNLMNWFELVAGTEVYLTAHNVYGDWNCPWDKPNHTNSVLYSDTPAFSNPKAFAAVHHQTYVLGRKYLIADMPALWFGLRQLNAKVQLVPDCLWVRNWYYKDKIIFQDNLYGKDYHLSEGTRMRIHMIHGKWWSPAHNDRLYKQWDDENAAIADPIQKDEHYRHYVVTAKNNIKLCHDWSVRMNTQHKLTLEFLGDI